MKNVFTSIQRIPIFKHKKSHFIDQMKLLQRSEIILCLLAGFLSRAELFHAIRPFGLSFYAAYAQKKAARVLIIVSIFFGNLFGGDLLSALKQTAAIILFEWIRKMISLKKRQVGPRQRALYIGAANAITGILVFVMNGQFMLEFFILIMEVIFVGMIACLFSWMLDKGDMPPAKHIEYRNIRLFGYFIWGGAFLLGISGIHFWGTHLNGLIASIGILIVARHFGPGLGACAGTIAGLMLSAGFDGSFAVYAGMYATAGMIAGILQKSKWASGIAFFVTGSLFSLITEEIFIEKTAMIIPVFLFLILPDIMPGKILAIKRRFGMENDNFFKAERIKRLVSERLSDMSRAFYRMGHVIEKQTKADRNPDGENINDVMEQLTEKLCSHCGRASVCWEAKLHHTYHVMDRLILSLQEGDANQLELKHELSRFCAKSSLVIDTLGQSIELKRVENVWKAMVQSNKRFIPEQIFSLSEFLACASGEVINEIEFFCDEEKKIERELKKKGYPVVYTEVQRNRNGRFTSEIRMENCKGTGNCPKEVCHAVSNVLGVPMQSEGDRCENSGKDGCVLYLTEREFLGVTTGIARLKKSNARVSGDSFTFLKTRDGKYVAAISDGMGSGIEANRLSEMAMELLEQFLDCSMSIQQALRLMNMILRMIHSEKYSTMDICIVDLYTGDTQFYKMGAVPSLITNGKTFDSIRIDSLPAGLQEEKTIHPENRKMTEGELIIMMSDGVYEQLNQGDDKPRLEKRIRRINTPNPQEMADQILKSACCEKESAKDDMTVLVVKLWRKAG